MKFLHCYPQKAGRSFALGLQSLLSADVQLVGDGGGKAPQLARAVDGAENVARLLATVYPLMARVDITFEPPPRSPGQRGPPSWRGWCAWRI
ncbi:sigma-70 family RNA polymerase sigma factor family protein [Streptosporangium soli]|nr:hypothetical protein [Streptosporangium sp. KLBMP 9127]